MLEQAVERTADLRPMLIRGWYVAVYSLIDQGSKASGSGPALGTLLRRGYSPRPRPVVVVANCVLNSLHLEDASY